MAEKITVDELTEFLNQFNGEYVVKILTEETISGVDELGRKRTGGAIFIDSKILLVEKDWERGEDGRIS